MVVLDRPRFLSHIGIHFHVRGANLFSFIVRPYIIHGGHLLLGIVLIRSPSSCLVNMSSLEKKVKPLAVLVFVIGVFGGCD